VVTQSDGVRCRDALATSTINCVTSFFAGFVIFSVLGYMSKKSRTPINEVATEGELAPAARVCSHVERRSNSSSDVSRTNFGRASHDKEKRARTFAISSI